MRLDTGATPGGCWAHFSSLDMDGYRTAQPGQAVTVEYESAHQDGFVWRAVRVEVDGVPRGTTDPDLSAAAYSSSLRIDLDDEG